VTRPVLPHRTLLGGALAIALVAPAIAEPPMLRIVSEPARVAPTDASLAFRSGAIDAWAIREPTISIEVQQFGTRRLVGGRGLTPSVMFVAAHGAASRDKRAALTDFLRRFRDGWIRARANIPAYAAYNSALTRISEPMLRSAYEIEAMVPAVLSAVVLAEYQAAARNAVTYGLLQRDVDVGRALDLNFAAAVG
jgi:sulfonate transport system substrate-binding protein